jgi:hypothetical protein
MVTQHAKSNRKVILGQRFLQDVWTGSTQQCGHSDKRLSVWDGECVSTDEKKSAPTAREPGAADEAFKSRNDGLLGSLLAESFLTAVFGPLLPVWAQSLDWTSAIDAVDEAWLDRRTKPVAQHLPASLSYAHSTYYPL